LQETLETSADFVAWGLGAWALFACLAPRVAILALPWIWSLCNGRWSLRYLGTEEWHHVRYTVLPVAIVLATGLVGYAHLGSGLCKLKRGAFGLAVIWTLAAAGCLLGVQELRRRMSEIPQPITAEEADAVHYWIGQVGADDCVLATYEVTAPLSSRRCLFSYILDQNKPKGFPTLGPEFRWVFLRNNNLDYQPFLNQGFDIVHRGGFVTILRRTGPHAREP
jgi:hypothetical protein